MQLPSFFLTTLYIATLSLVAVHADQPVSPATPQPGCHHFKKSQKVMGYYPSYNYKDQKPTDINFSLYTDALFFVAVPERNFTLNFGDLKNEIAERLMFDFVKQAKEANVTTCLSVGGWTGSQHFSFLTSTPDNRKKFAQLLVNYTQSRGFNCIDLDWEYPNHQGIGCNGINPKDTVNFGLLLKEIRALWKEAQLTVALSITGLVGADGKPATIAETKDIVESVDFVNIMAYDVTGQWSESTGPLAPLKATCAPEGSAVSVETSVTAMLKAGFKVSQLIMGIPAYAKRLELVSPKLLPKVVNGTTTFYYQNHTDKAPPGGKFDDQPGVDVCGKPQTYGGSWTVRELIAQGWLQPDFKTGGKGYKRYYDECSEGPFLASDKYLISYDDLESSVNKAQFSKSQQLAGIYFFDTLGTTDATIKAAGEALR
ncbi:hypothetical protein O181_034076 [Austropuccinia psidii MF-1]|uniref:GH18 domain-containing protein n=1 Tax=Austropuccinia psidii MF-1 TaxID=1389203 RepID=A0A9Q3D5N4_9BASI|nr:hypothetical protein [Austropuccinia psidii MF-1]